MVADFSVLLSVYYKESPEYLSLALDSVFGQTLQSDDVVLVEDGHIDGATRGCGEIL
jgi:glycosyltransferase involved in cell wall biosynthesis